MVKSLWSRVQKGFLKSRAHSVQGFTLLELLVVTAIGGIIVSGLTFIVVQMMTADQREASRSETQREMQMALDYMATELREAIYVYPGNYLENCGNRCAGGGLVQFLPENVRRNSVPVLAFWKQQPFPEAIKTQCANGSANPQTVACLSGQSYALVVYSLRRNEAADRPQWQGKARITRYVLSQFLSNGDPNPGYVNPSDAGIDFTTWPFGKDENTGALVNKQTAPAGGQAATLVDFVSFDIGDTALANEIGRIGTCTVTPETEGEVTTEYQISPSNGMLTGQFAGVRSFYACVSTATRRVTQGGAPVAVADPTRYQDTVLFLRGSAAGRPGISNDTAGAFFTNNNPNILPTLQTRVLSRSVLGRKPTE
ncbi:MAG: prepilin-type N-terminal cleavage/methylation domain-containing protein [Elainella sp. Prado103]|jgi:prepilin-type N-terminal cleavage/methylation domain-containing protein|nr:prepilin-type N-terminal cleavage/methylation domain-containing protein [Elainella sp. Prado103]